MMIRFKCGQCGTSVKVDAQHAGKQAKCPGCQSALRIPSKEQIAAASSTKMSTPVDEPVPEPQTAPQFDDDDFELEEPHAPPQPQLSDNPYSSPAAVSDVPQQQFAGFWIRLGAWLIDYIIVILVGGGIGMIIGFVGFAIGLDQNAISVVAQLAGIVIAWLYYALQEASVHQATFGKRAVGLKVVDANGDVISFARATGRYFAKFLSWILLCVGFILIAFHSEKQGLHDILAKTYVVKQ